MVAFFSFSFLASPLLCRPPTTPTLPPRSRPRACSTGEACPLRVQLSVPACMGQPESAGKPAASQHWCNAPHSYQVGITASLSTRTTSAPCRVGQPKPGQEPPTFEARLYDVLFKGQNPAALVSWLCAIRQKVWAVKLGSVSSCVGSPLFAASGSTAIAIPSAKLSSCLPCRTTGWETLTPSRWWR